MVMAPLRGLIRACTMAPVQMAGGGST